MDSSSWWYCRWNECGGGGGGTPEGCDVRCPIQAANSFYFFFLPAVLYYSSVLCRDIAVHVCIAPTPFPSHPCLALITREYFFFRIRESFTARYRFFLKLSFIFFCLSLLLFLFCVWNLVLLLCAWCCCIVRFPKHVFFKWVTRKL